MEFQSLRKKMVEFQLMARGIKDTRVLDVFLKIPRHEFVPEELIKSAYEDCPLPIGNGQTISQPYMVALMTELLGLTGREKVLELGTGSGYQTAVLAELAKEVYSIERIKKLSKAAWEQLQRFNYSNVKLEVGDGSLGWAEFAPYDAIIVTASAPETPKILIEQLKDNGRLVIPVGGRFSQELLLIEKEPGEIKTHEICGCVFVPLLGEQGWRMNNE
ncbi:MAG: protein-L-isoaspartate(D-aspartate) O-methyltransferase [Candidatus Omnitrophota bacterium]